MPPREGTRFYLCEFSYTTEGWRLLVRDEKSRNRVGLLRALLREFKGCFGIVIFPCAENGSVTVQPEGPTPPDEPPPPKPDDGDGEKYVAMSADRHIKTLLAFPGEAPATAFAMAVAQSGLVTNITMTPLMPWRDAMAAMAQADRGRKSKPPLGWT